MIQSRKSSTEKKAGSQFREWSRLFSGKIFVMIVVYADESGTHDRAHKQCGSRIPVLSGYVDTIENWSHFCDSWKLSLTKHRAKYFHFSELTKTQRSKPGTEFHGWNDDRTADFIYDLAPIAASTAVPVGGMCDGLKAIKYSKDSFSEIFESFFLGVSNAVSHFWPEYDGKIEFIFDRKDDDVRGGPLYLDHR